MLYGSRLELRTIRLGLRRHLSRQKKSPGRKRFALRMAPPGHAIEVGAYYSREEPSTIKASLINAGSTPIGYMSLPGGETVGA
jgi:hypothetical protein